MNHEFSTNNMMKEETIQKHSQTMDRDIGFVTNKLNAKLQIPSNSILEPNYNEIMDSTEKPYEEMSDNEYYKEQKKLESFNAQLKYKVFHENPNVLLIDPNENKPWTNIIVLKGLNHQMDQARKKILSIIFDSNRHVKIEIPLDEKCTENLVGKNGKRLNKLFGNRLSVRMIVMFNKQLTIFGFENSIDFIHNEIKKQIKDIDDCRVDFVHFDTQWKEQIILSIRHLNIQSSFEKMDSFTSTIYLKGNYALIQEAKKHISETIIFNENSSVDASILNSNRHRIFTDDHKSKIFCAKLNCRVVFPKKKESTNTILLDGAKEEMEWIRKTIITNIQEISSYVIKEVQIRNKSLIIGVNGKAVNKLGDTYKIINIICWDRLTSIGKQTNIEHFCRAIESMERKRAEEVQDFISVDPKWSFKFTHKLINQISQNNGKVKITFAGKIFKGVYNLRGQRDQVDSAIEDISEIVQQLETESNCDGQLFFFTPQVKQKLENTHTGVQVLNTKSELSESIVLNGDIASLNSAKLYIFNLNENLKKHKPKDIVIPKKFQNNLLAKKGHLINTIAAMSQVRALYLLNYDIHSDDSMIVIGESCNCEKFEEFLNQEIETNGMKKNPKNRNRLNSLATGSMKLATKSAANLDAFSEKPIDAPAITEENKGYKMLQKMGWQPGDGSDPIVAVIRPKKLGLGFNSKKEDT